MWLSTHDLKKLENTETGAFRSPVQTQMVSNGEEMPLPQTRAQRAVEHRIKAMADAHGERLGMGRRQFLQTSCGVAAAFSAMNEVFGALFRMDPAEAVDTAAAEERLALLAGEFIIDGQTHHVHDHYSRTPVLRLTEYAQGKNPQRKAWNPKLGTEPPTLDRLRFDRYIKDVFLDSDTKVAILSGFTAENSKHMALTSDQIVGIRNLFNELKGSRRMHAHGLFWPGKPGNLEEMDRMAQQLKIDSWKGYTVGDPSEAASKYPWMMDDEKVAFACWEKAENMGFETSASTKGCSHPTTRPSRTGAMPVSPMSLGRLKRSLGSISSSITRPSGASWTSRRPTTFEQPAYISWIGELAEIPKQHGVTNVYAAIGATFGSTVITHPGLAAGILGTLIKGLGADHVIWAQIRSGMGRRSGRSRHSADSKSRRI